jgi:hypothetical protein
MVWYEYDGRDADDGRLGIWLFIANLLYAEAVCRGARTTSSSHLRPRDQPVRAVSRDLPATGILQTSVHRGVLGSRFLAGRSLIRWLCVVASW